jgi:regulator of extracellular matrix RemA (YlzA/DUF370 family)
MSEDAQEQRHGLSGRHHRLTSAEESEILRLAVERRNQHEVIDASWTRATIAVVTEGRIPNASDSLIS